MIILRTPKGWTGPKTVDGHKVEGFWRAHQIPILDPADQPASTWRRWKPGCAAIKPEELFDESGRLIEELREMAPVGTRRITANPHANGGLLRRPLEYARFSRLCSQGRASRDKSKSRRPMWWRISCAT